MNVARRVTALHRDGRPFARLDMPHITHPLNSHSKEYMLIDCRTDDVEEMFLVEKPKLISFEKEEKLEEKGEEVSEEKKKNNTFTDDIYDFI